MAHDLRLVQTDAAMTPARWLNLALIGVYLVLAALYGWDGNLGKTLYWLGAAILGTGVLLS